MQSQVSECEESKKDPCREVELMMWQNEEEEQRALKNRRGRIPEPVCGKAYSTAISVRVKEILTWCFVDLFLTSQSLVHSLTASG